MIVLTAHFSLVWQVLFDTQLIKKQSAKIRQLVMQMSHYNHYRHFPLNSLLSNEMLNTVATYRKPRNEKGLYAQVYLL